MSVDCHVSTEYFHDNRPRDFTNECFNLQEVDVHFIIQTNILFKLFNVYLIVLEPIQNIIQQLMYLFVKNVTQ